MNIEFVKKLIAKGDGSFEDYVASATDKEKKRAIIDFIDLSYGKSLREDGLLVVRSGKVNMPAVTKILYHTDNLFENYLNLTNELPITEYFVDRSNYLVFTTSCIHSMVNGNYQCWKYSDLEESDESVLQQNDWRGLPDFMEFGHKTKSGDMKIALENRIPFLLAIDIKNILRPHGKE